MFEAETFARSFLEVVFNLVSYCAILAQRTIIRNENVFKWANVHQ